MKHSLRIILSSLCIFIVATTKNEKTKMIRYCTRSKIGVFLPRAFCQILSSSSKNHHRCTTNIYQPTMSLRSFNSPPLVAAAGISTLVGIPFLETLTFSASTAVLKGLNLTAFAANGENYVIKH